MNNKPPTPLVSPIIVTYNSAPLRARRGEQAEVEQRIGAHLRRRHRSRRSRRSMMSGALTARR